MFISQVYREALRASVSAAEVGVREKYKMYLSRNIVPHSSENVKMASQNEYLFVNVVQL